MKNNNDDNENQNKASDKQRNNGNSPNKYLTSPTDFLNILNPAMLEVWHLLDTIFSFRFNAKPPTRLATASSTA